MRTAHAADDETFVAIAAPYDLARTLSTHRRGSGDPGHRVEASGAVWRATRTADGPVTLFLQPAVGGVRVRAWGPGAGLAVEAAPALLGAEDDPAALVPRHPAVAEGARRGRGIRIGRSGAVWEALVPAILEQKITGEEARRTYRGPRACVRRGRARAAGPAPAAGARDAGAAPVPRVPPTRPGASSGRADPGRRARGAAAGASRDRRRRGITGRGAFGRARRRLRRAPRVSGIGPWTAAEVGFRAFGDADAVSVGDFHIPQHGVLGARA